jgi:pyruvate dehydrogenase E1 component alpha subunit
MNGIVGVSHILAAGAAYGIKVKGTKQVAVAFGGDGSVNNGWFYGGLKNAAHYKLPLIIVIENNGWQVSNPTENSIHLRNLSTLAKGLEVPGYTVDGQDVLAVHSVMRDAVARARNGEGPTLIEAKTYRFYDHNGLAGAEQGVLGAFGLPYRSDRDVRAWIANDPLTRFRDQLIAIGILTEEGPARWSGMSRSRCRRRSSSRARALRPSRIRDSSRSTPRAPSQRASSWPAPDVTSSVIGSKGLDSRGA